MKAAKGFLERLARLGVEDCFLVPGGAIMHLVDELHQGTGQVRAWAFHDERTAAMAAEGYARIKGKPALLLVSSGPGVLHALSGVWGAHLDSVPMIIVSGQVRSDTINDDPGCRQLGDQELPTTYVVHKLVKAQFPVSSDTVLGDLLPDRAWLTAISGRPGPVWIDWPVDLQGKDCWASSELQPGLIGPSREDVSGYACEKVLKLIARSERPVVIVGNGIRAADACEELEQFATQSKLPLVTAFSHDQIDHDHPQWIGRQGTLGDRAGNLAAQRADLLIVLGCRMSIRQTTYDWAKFAPDAKRVMIDVDEAEMRKPNFRVDLPVVGCVKSFLKKIVDRNLRVVVSGDALPDKVAKRAEWLVQCQTWRDKYPTTKRSESMLRIDYLPQGQMTGVGTQVNEMAERKHTDAGLDPYLFLSDLLDRLPDDVVVVTGNATAYIVTHQVSTGRHRMFSNSGCASMGYGIAAAIGAAVAGAKVLCVEGDGSVMQNLSALASLAEFDLPVNVVVLCNGGYASIKATHQRMFGRKPSEPRNLCQGDLAQIIAKFQLPTDCYGNSLAHVEVDVENAISDCTDFSTPGVNVIELDPSIPIEPRLEARVMEGQIVTATLDKMTPEVEE